MRKLADRLTEKFPQKDKAAEINALYKFVRDRIRYSWDTHGLETLQTPDYTLERRQGDCDDKSILLATLLMIKGHKARFVAIGLDPGKPSYCHVYVETIMGRTRDGKSRWSALETTEPVTVGWQPTGVRRAMVYHL